MSNSELSSTAQKTPESSEPTIPPTFAQRVDTVVSSMTKDSNGVLQFPQGEISEEVKYAAMSEKRRRDTHGSYTKSRQELAKATAERDALKNKLASNISLNLTIEQTDDLNKLKFDDPDAWRAKLAVHENEAHKILVKDLDEVTTQAALTSELANREQVLSDFNKANPGFSLVDDDVPPRISKKLESGDITFADFLSEVQTYIQTPKKVLIAEHEEEPNLSTLAGGSAPQKRAIAKSVVEDYSSSDIF